MRALAHFFGSTSRAQESALFMSLIDRMAFDQQDPDLSLVEYLPGELFDRFKECCPFANKGSKVNFNRFMSLLKESRLHSSSWTQLYFAHELVCLEQGYFTGGKFQRLL
eukprot:15939642-Heterocapsa_arctica.AAC.1